MTFSLDLPTLSAPLIPLAIPEITTIAKLVGYTPAKAENAQSKSSRTCHACCHPCYFLWHLPHHMALAMVTGHKVLHKLNYMNIVIVSMIDIYCPTLQPLQQVPTFRVHKIVNFSSHEVNQACSPTKVNMYYQFIVTSNWKFDEIFETSFHVPHSGECPLSEHIKQLVNF
jgi:hypothetical protein